MASLPKTYFSMIRIFVAFPLKNEMAKSFLQLSETNLSDKNIRWTPKDNLHITLFFIDEIEEINLVKIKSEIRNVFKKQKSFTLEYKEISFKGKKRSSMIWAEFYKNNFFSDLSENIKQSVKDFMTIEIVHYDPIPHCTLARIKPGADVSSVNKTIHLSEKTLNVDRAELWKTVQSKDGVKYESLEKFEFV